MIIWLFVYCAANGPCEQIPVKTEAQCETLVKAHKDGVCTPVKLWSAHA